MTPLTPNKFIFLRHGETDWNAKGLSQGRTDIALNAAGIAQAGDAAVLLGGQGITRVVCSTLGRARQTARIVADRLGVAVVADPDLQEAGFGVQEGQKMSGWYDDWVQRAITPDGGESFAALQARVIPAMNRAITGGGLVLIVAHGAMFRAVRAAMGLSALVRTENGVALVCVPGVPWRLEQLGREEG